MSYAITGLPVEPFQPLFGLPDGELAKHNVVRMIADAPVGLFSPAATLFTSPILPSGPVGKYYSCCDHVLHLESRPRPYWTRLHERQEGLG